VSVSSAVSVLERDPDLGEALAPEEFPLARHQAIARVRRYPKGCWSAALTAFDRAGALGLLIMDGLLVRQVTVGDRTRAELLGPGDVTPRGVQLDISLSHRLLALVVGARRASVTASVRELIEATNGRHRLRSRGVRGPTWRRPNVPDS
jgi:hypothetical protein